MTVGVRQEAPILRPTGLAAREAKHKHGPISGWRSCCSRTPSLGCPGLSPLPLLYLPIPSGIFSWLICSCPQCGSPTQPLPGTPPLHHENANSRGPETGFSFPDHLQHLAHAGTLEILCEQREAIRELKNSFKNQE